MLCLHQLMYVKQQTPLYRLSSMVFVLLELINWLYKPHLLYALEHIELSASCINKLHRSWNIEFWKLFHINECTVLAVQH